MNQDNNHSHHVREERPTDWFEPLYARSGTHGQGVPWANMKTHPAFHNWLGRHPLDGSGKSALVVGCGMGDDAIELESLGFAVTAFDVSQTAIAYCKKRFPDSKVNFVQADLFAPHPDWIRRFDFVLEIYTIQALPPKYEEEVIRNIAEFVAPDGELLVIANVDTQARTIEKGPPWLLTPDHIDAIALHGFHVDKQHVETPKDVHDGRGIYVTAFRRTGI